MAANQNGLVAVGVDGAAKGLAAVDPDAYETAMRGHSLALIRAIPWPLPDFLAGPELGRMERAERDQAAAEPDAARARALAVAPWRSDRRTTPGSGS
jgi:hypothetical protein